MRAGFKIIRYILIFTIVFIIVIYASKWFHFLNTPVIPAGQHVDYILKPGTSLTKFANDFHHKGYLTHPKLFILMAKFHEQAGNIKAGHYQFNGPIKPAELLNQIVNGKVIQSRLTLLEGWTFKEVMDAVNNCQQLQHTLQNKTPQQIMAAIGHPNQHPEGMFYPDTYHFPEGSSDVDFLKRAYNTMQSHLSKAWENRVDNLPYKNSYQALIAASLIEKETALNSEKPKIAGVLIRRLEKNMLLQFDPTVIYGLGEKYQGNLTRENMRVDTPYNTYLYKGLPPTPIAIPSVSSITAALHPEKGKALYFVARGDGSHVFTNNLKDHRNAIVEYLRNRKKRTAQKDMAPSAKVEDQLIPPSEIIPENCYQVWQEGGGLAYLKTQQICYHQNVCSKLFPDHFNGHHCAPFNYSTLIQ